MSRARIQHEVDISEMVGNQGGIEAATIVWSVMEVEDSEAILPPSNRCRCSAYILHALGAFLAPVIIIFGMTSNQGDTWKLLFVR